MKRIIKQITLGAILTCSMLVELHAFNCTNFQDTVVGIAVPMAQTNYGPAWYFNNGITLSSKYVDYTLNSQPGSVNIADHVAANYVGANGSTNYVGNIFYQGDADTRFDLTGVGFNPKKIEFDVNGIMNNGSANPYLINGQPLTSLPAGITYISTPLTNGYHIEITGNVNTFEVLGHEVGVDNLCIDSIIASPPPPAGPGCIEFQDTTLGLAVAMSQTVYGPSWYFKNGITFSSKYVDYTLNSQPGSVTIADHVAANYIGANGSTNYVGNIFYQGDADTKIDFTGVGIGQMRVEFDVNYILNSSTVNPFLINGQVLTTLPAGISYLATPLTNGYHIEITGAINTIEIKGHEVGLDNLCVDSLVIPQVKPQNLPSNEQNIITPNGDGQNDYIDLKAGSRIYDRNGFLVKNVVSDIKWYGMNDNNSQLPMGSYTAIGPNNTTIQITIIK